MATEQPELTKIALWWSLLTWTKLSEAGLLYMLTRIWGLTMTWDLSTQRKRKVKGKVWLKAPSDRRELTQSSAWKTDLFRSVISLSNSFWTKSWVDSRMTKVWGKRGQLTQSRTWARYTVLLSLRAWTILLKLNQSLSWTVFNRSASLRASRRSERASWRREKERLFLRERAMRRAKRD